MQIEILGNAEIVAEQNGALIIKTQQAEARVTVYSPTIIRVCITRDLDKIDASYAVIEKPLDDFTWQKLGNVVEITTSALKLVINTKPLRFNFYTADGKPLSQDDPRFGTNWQAKRVITYRKLYPDEKFIGLGEKLATLTVAAATT